MIRVLVGNLERAPRSDLISGGAEAVVWSHTSREFEK